ncbi:hypothetical protein ACFQRL_03840 [Microbacterium fluvii]|uniref:Leucyl-tRNA synthetase n=1 Tax=Microbacterium fluvii TaxID=415215 RepID=A0ABW2HF51_9MICO|nr:hypothetical protein [Microbacterium fluvii]MCU4671725.1 hypothetical protein [Microbacterium fluvii]
MDAADALAEIFTWVGLAAGIVAGAIGIAMLLADGAWAPVRIMIDDAPTGRVARWFDAAGGVNEAVLTPHQVHQLAGADQARAFAKVGVPHQLRLTKTAPAALFTLRLSAGFLAVGVVAAIVSLVLLFARG